MEAPAGKHSSWKVAQVQLPAELVFGVLAKLRISISIFVSTRPSGQSGDDRYLCVLAGVDTKSDSSKF